MGFIRICLRCKKIGFSKKEGNNKSPVIRCEICVDCKQKERAVKGEELPLPFRG